MRLTKPALLTLALMIAFTTACSRNQNSADEQSRNNAQGSQGQTAGAAQDSNAGRPATANSMQGQVVVAMKDAKGQDVGTATLMSGTRGVVVKLDVKNLPEGEHAIHFHEKPACDPPDFKTAGAHFNPEGKKHGSKADGGAHAGDMDNFKVGKDGTSDASISNDRVELSDASANSVFANGGTALVIHEKPDDMKTDPSGNSGNRIACGVVKR